MRKLFVILVLAGAAAFVLTGVRHRRARIESYGPVIGHVEFPTAPVPPMPRIEPRYPPQYTVRTVSATSRKGRNVPVAEPVELTVTGNACATREEAWDDAMAQAVLAIEDRFGVNHAVAPADMKDRGLIVESKEHDVPTGTSVGEAKKVELTVRLEPDYVRELGKREREYVMTERMGWLARGLAVLVAGLFAVAGYVRLDEWSKGYYTGVLKAVAVAAVAAAGVAAWYAR